jgi:hypothetical protein
MPILWSRILICKNTQNYTLITSDMIPAHSYLVKYVDKYVFKLQQMLHILFIFVTWNAKTVISQLQCLAIDLRNTAI